MSPEKYCFFSYTRFCFVLYFFNPLSKCLGFQCLCFDLKLVYLFAGFCSAMHANCFTSILLILNIPMTLLIWGFLTKLYKPKTIISHNTNYACKKLGFDHVSLGSWMCSRSKGSDMGQVFLAYPVLLYGDVKWGPHMVVMMQFISRFTS